MGNSAGSLESFDIYSIVAEATGHTRDQVKKHILSKFYEEGSEKPAKDKFAYHRWIEPVQNEDFRELMRKDKSYGASWKKRGGIGAFMMSARVWDRMEEMVTKRGAFGGGDKDAMPYDIFSWIIAENRDWNKTIDGHRYVGRDGSVLACVRDLRRYLTLLEAEMMEQEAIPRGTRKLPQEETT